METEVSCVVFGEPSYTQNAIHNREGSPLTACNPLSKNGINLSWNEARSYGYHFNQRLEPRV